MGRYDAAVVCLAAGGDEDEQKRMEEGHQKPVGRMISSAEGRVGLLHRIAKLAAWRGGLQVLEGLEEDAKTMRRCEEKKERVGEALAM